MKLLENICYAKRGGEELSLDGDSVYKNKGESIILVTQPERPVDYQPIRYSAIQLESFEVAKALIEGDYSYIRVVGEETVTTAPSVLVMNGNVVGFRIVGGETFMMREVTLNATVVKDKPIDIILLVYSDGSAAPQG